MKTLWRGPSRAGLLLIASVVLLPAQAFAAGGAFVVDDSEIGKPGECKVESWASAAANHDFTAVTSPACVVKLGLPVEFTGFLQRSRTDSAWSTIGTAQAKTNLIPLANRGFGLGLVGGASWDMITGASTGGYVYVPLTVQVMEKVRVNLNAGWIYDAIPKANYLIYGAGFEWDFVKKFTLIGEVFGQFGKVPEGYPATVSQPRAQLGVRYTPVEKIDIDLIYGHNLMGESSHWLTLGVNYRF
jgi:hypothetical protein